MSNTIINGGASPYPKHVGPAAICSFSDGAQDAPLKSLKFYIEPSQSGSGDPSPTNIRPISGWTQVDGKQSGADMTDYTPITISLGQTVYGGAVDALAGKMTITDAIFVFDGSSDENWNTWAGNNAYYVRVTGGYKVGNMICNAFKWAGRTNSSTGRVIGEFIANADAPNGTWNGNISFFYDNNVGGLANFKAWLAQNPIQVVYTLKDPIEVDLTPVSVNSLLGQNNIWANTGDTELDYYPAAASVVAVLNKSSKVYTAIPLGKIRYDTYQTTPNQALDLDSYRAETGVLIRNVLSHTATKIEFNTPSMTNLQWEEVWNIIKAGFNNSTERKLKLKYYDQMSATYKTGWFYVPDVNFTIRNIDEANGIINYDEIRVAFIEY